MRKMLGIREKIFILVALFVTSVLSLVRFIIAFARECNLINETSNYEYIDEIIDFSSINYIKVIMIMLICLAILLLICSCLYLAIRNINVKRGILLVGMSLLLLAVVFFFVSRFICADYYSKDIVNGSEAKELLCLFGEEYHQNAIYLIFTFITAMTMHFVALSLSNDYMKDGETEEGPISEVATVEENELNEEIAKLKAKIKIKNLEQEYLKLKAQLDE